MRHDSSVTSITWIPSEAIRGAAKLPFSVGVGHYDAAPPDALDAADIGASLTALRDDDRFRFANHLSGWIEVDDDGRIVDFGQGGASMIGSTTVRFGKSFTVAATAYETLCPVPEVGDGWVRFRQSGGGRTGLPAPRHVNRPPFVQIVAPTAWTTVELTLHADGRAEAGLAGASPFPRHWLYGADGTLVGKSGMIDFREWYRHAFGAHSPWGEEDSPAVMTEAESALERELSTRIMRTGRRPRIRTLADADVLTEQGDEGDELFLLLDGVLGVEVDGERLAELGPGVVVGERATLGDGRRTASLIALTPCRVAVARRDELAVEALTALSAGHRREDQRETSGA